MDEAAAAPPPTTAADKDDGTQGEMKLDQLPDDALGLILARVDDLHPVASTSKRLRDACADPSVLIGFLAAGVHAAESQSSGSANNSTAAAALRSTPPLFAAIKWRATRRFRADPQALAEFCCALIDALTPVGGQRDLAARRGARKHDRRAPLGGRAVGRGGSRGPPVPRAGVARMGCDAPYARPYLHAALAHSRARRPIHALVALASALPPVLQPLLLPHLVQGGHAEAALRLLDAEGCLDQPGCFGGRFDLDLDGGAGPGALLPADMPLLPRLRVAARACRLGLREGEDEWWWWWLPRGGGGGGGGLARSPEEEARLLRRLDVSGLRCLRWALWEPVRLGDRPPRGVPPCAGGGVRRAAVAPLAMALAAAVRLVAADARMGPSSSSSSPSSSRRLLWALTEATMFARIFRHHMPGKWWRWSPLFLPGTCPSDEAEEPLHEYDGGEDEDDEDDDEGFAADEDEGLGAGAGVPTHAAFGQWRVPETAAQRRRAWRLRGQAAFLDASRDGGGADDDEWETPAPYLPRRPEYFPAFAFSSSSSEDAGGGPAGTGAASPPLLPWSLIVAGLSRASSTSLAAVAAAPAAAAGAGAAAAESAATPPVVAPKATAALASVRLLDPRSQPVSLFVRLPSADPVGALFGPPDDPLALPALIEIAACAQGAAALRDAWAEAGGARGRALFARSCERASLLAALAYGGGGGQNSSSNDRDGANDADAALFRDALAGAFHPSPAHVQAGFKDALCAAGEAGNARAMRLLIGSPRLTFGALSGALSRACGGAAYRVPQPPARAEAWHPAGATLSPALSPPSSREWPDETLALLLGALTGRRFREEAAEALAPALSVCLIRRPADRERTLRAVWDALVSVPVSAENLASRTGQRAAPTSGRGSGAVEGRGEPSSVLALLAARGDAERVDWILRSAPTAAFKARAYPVLLALERGHGTLARRILDAPRVSDGFGPGIRQAEARGRVYVAARLGRAEEVREALRDVQIVAKNAWWSPLLAEMIANAAAMAAGEEDDAEDEDDDDDEEEAEEDEVEGGGGSGSGPYMRVLRVLVQAASGKLGAADGYAAALGVALGRGWAAAADRPWRGPPPRARTSSGGAGAGADQDARLLLLPRPLARFLPRAVEALCFAAADDQDATFDATALALVAALLADGSPRALAAIARLERPAAGRELSWSVGLDVGLLLARHPQLRWPLPAATFFDLGNLVACGGAPGGWVLPSERPFPAASVLSAACRPGGPVALAIQEARAAAGGDGDGDGADVDGDGDGDADGDSAGDGEEDAGDAGLWAPNEDAWPQDAPLGLRRRVRYRLTSDSVLAPPPPPLVPDMSDPLRWLQQEDPPRPRAMEMRSRPWPALASHALPISRAASAAVQARGDLPLAIAALLAWRGARALVDAHCVWQSFGGWEEQGGGDGAAAAATAGLWRAPPGAPPLASVADIGHQVPANMARGAELAAELEPL